MLHDAVRMVRVLGRGRRLRLAEDERTRDCTRGLEDNHSLHKNIWKDMRMVTQRTRTELDLIPGVCR